MKKYTYNLNVTNKITSFPALLEVIVDKGDIALTLNADITYAVHDIYPFRALNKIRKKLEEKNLFITCKGSRIDVHYTGATLIGFKAYQIKEGNALKLKNCINIFDIESDLDVLSTVDEQDKYFKNWLESMRVK